MVQKVVLGFRDYLIRAWPAFLQQLKYVPSENQEYVIEDWLQVNWELLVERALCQHGQFLLGYGNGGDANGASDRIIFPEAIATHAITCYPKEGDSFINAFDGTAVKAAQCSWEKFATLHRSKQYYEEAPPFDHVLFLKNYRDLVLVPVAEVVFGLEKIA